MKLALHRSIIFWSGLLVMAFLCWAWWHSTKARAQWITRYLIIFHEGSGITVFNNSGRPPAPKPFYFIYRPIKEPHERFHALRFARPQFEPGLRPGENIMQRVSTDYTNPNWFLLSIISAGQSQSWVAFIPHWLILLIFTIPWSALLLWRARRRKRASPFSAAED